MFKSFSTWLCKNKKIFISLLLFILFCVGFLLGSVTLLPQPPLELLERELGPFLEGSLKTHNGELMSSTIFLEWNGGSVMFFTMILLIFILSVKIVSAQKSKFSKILFAVIIMTLMSGFFIFISV